MRRPGNGIGLILILVGLLLLLSNLGYIRFGWGQIWPVFLLVFGLSLFLQFFQGRDKGVLVPAALFVGSGIFFFFFTLPNGLGWGDMIKWWPIFPLLMGIGFFLGYLADLRDTSFLIPAIIFSLFGGLSLAGNLERFRIYLKFWPLLLILVGLATVLSNMIPNKKGK